MNAAYQAYWNNKYLYLEVENDGVEVDESSKIQTK